MTMVRVAAVAAILLALALGGSHAAAAAPPGSSAATSGAVTLGSQARWVSPLAINVHVTWECSPQAVAFLRVDVVQPSALLGQTWGIGLKLIVCDGASHSAAMTVRALVGSFQLGDAFGTARLTVLHGPPVTFADERQIQIAA